MKTRTAPDFPPTDAVAYFSQVAEDFHASYKADANRQERIRVWTGFLDRYLGHSRFAYDLGCGSGIFACDLARRGIETIGIDGAANMLAIARATAAADNLGIVSFRQHRLPVADPSGWRVADAIISSSALEYLPSMAEALACVHALLRPGGVVVFSVSNAQSLTRKAVRVVHRLTGKPAYFGLLKQFMTVAQLDDALHAAGFAMLDHVYFAKADRMNRTLALLVPERLASNMIIVAARRL